MEKQNATEYQSAVFSVAHTDIGMMPFNNHGRTLRVVLESNAAAHGLSVLFSNRCGAAKLPVGAASLALCSRAGVLAPGTLAPLTVGGRLAFDIPAGEEVPSDVIRFALQPGQHYALNLYYPTGVRVQSGNWSGAEVLRSRPGNFSADLHLNPPGLVSRLARTVVAADITVTTTTVAHIVAHTAAPHRVVACFGDSITQQSNWTLPFTRLLYRRYPGQVSVCNLGISGNRLLGGSPPTMGLLYGEAGVRRFARDLLRLPGLTHAVLELGSNDLGLPGAHGLPDSELIAPEDYAAAMAAMAQRLHEENVKAYAATICPRPLAGPYDEAREGLRRRINEWILTADCFDAVLDFDAVLRRADGLAGMQDGYALPDGLHPSPLGGMVMAKSIDLSLFAGDADG